METELMIFDENNVINSIKKLDSLFPDTSVNNDIIISNDGNNDKTVEIIGQSIKRSSYSNIVLNNSTISNTAFSGSRFHNFVFKNTMINGNSFICSVFENFKIESINTTDYCANNFSKSYFNDCKFFNSKFISSTWLEASVNNSTFEDCVIQSCTLEGTVFKNCHFINTKMSSANLDYMILDGSELKNVEFPFYQFAYIIGITNYINTNEDGSVTFKVGNKIASLLDYKTHINELINYYYARGEYFPMSNLLISVHCIEDAKRFIILGIKCALNKNDYRLVKHFCLLCKYNDLLNYELTDNIKNEIDKYLLNIDCDTIKLNDALIKTAEINAMIDERATNKTSLQLEIQTNIDRNDEKSQEKIDQLISDCKYILDNPVFKNDGHTIREISYSPISIAFSVLGDAVTLYTIGCALQQFLLYIKAKNSKSTRELAKDICKKYKNIDIVDASTRIELAKSKIENSILELKRYQGIKSGKKYDEFITSITQKIIGDVDNILDDDMLVMKIGN